MKIAAHTLVKNEGRFVWYCVMSVATIVDKIYLWDTGSTDSTKIILNEIKATLGTKVDLKYLNEVDIYSFSEARQKMLDETQEDWFIMLDADEIWWDGSIKNVVDFIYESGLKYESVVVPTINLVGDMYHRQEEKAGLYNLAGKVGHYNIRAVNRNIPGLKSDKPHGTWGWADGKGIMIQDRDINKIKYLDAPYLHATFLQRADTPQEDNLVPKRQKKRKHELGHRFPLDYYYPESFFRPRPDIVKSVWEPMDRNFYWRAKLETPFRKMKRRIFPSRIGY